MSKDIQQIYEDQPATNMELTDLLYLGRDPFAVDDDYAITFDGFQKSITEIGTLAFLNVTGNVKGNTFIPGYTTTATASSTTVLTAASTYMQYFTGILTQTVTMPVTSTLFQGQSWLIVNKSTGNVTVQSSGGNTIIVLEPNTSAVVTCIVASGTTSSSWNALYSPSDLGVLSAQGTENQVLVNGTFGIPVEGDLIFTLPQDIGTASTPTFLGLQLDSGFIYDENGVGAFAMGSVASAVNYVRVFNAITGNPALVEAVGDDTDVGLNIITKGAGQIGLLSGSPTQPIVIYSGTAGNHITRFVMADTGADRTATWQDSSGTIAWTSDITAALGDFTFTGDVMSTATLNTNLSIIPNGTGQITGYSATPLATFANAIQLIKPGSDTSYVASSYRALNTGPKVYFVKSRSTSIGSFTAVQNGDQIGGFQGWADNGASLVYTGGIEYAVSGAVSGIFVPTSLRFYTSSSSVAGVLALTIDNNQAATFANSISMNGVINGATALRSAAGLNIATLTAGASAVNYLTLTSVGTGQAVVLGSAGSDTNVDMRYLPQAAGIHNFLSTNSSPFIFQTGTGYQHTTTFTFFDTAQSRTYTWPDASGTVALTSGVPSIGNFTFSSDQMTISTVNGNMTIVPNGTGKIGIGPLATTASAFGTVQFNGGTTNFGIGIGCYLNNASGPTLNFTKSRNATPGSFTTVQTNDIVGFFNFNADDGTTYKQCASIVTRAVGTISTNIVPTQMAFSTTSAAGALTQALLLDSGQNAVFAAGGSFASAVAMSTTLDVTGILSGGNSFRIGSNSVPASDPSLYIFSPTTMLGAFGMTAANNAGNFIGLMTNASLSAARTWTFPNATGTVILSASSGIQFINSGSLGTVAGGFLAFNGNAFTAFSPTSNLGSIALQSANNAGNFSNILTNASTSAARTWTLPDITGTVAIPVSGTFTPTFTFSTPGDQSIAYAIQNGSYTQIGRVVYFSYSVRFTPTYTTASGNALFGGLPVAIDNTVFYQIPANSSQGNAIWPAGVTQLYFTTSSTSAFLLAGDGSGTVQANFTTAQFLTGVQQTISASGFYFV